MAVAYLHPFYSVSFYLAPKVTVKFLVDAKCLHCFFVDTFYYGAYDSIDNLVCPPGGSQ